ncbi:HAMP domain-containing sensor histidine kinase [Brevibacillus brevis]|uniref:HAMP domain-containing sensor histidine kinase n=1 Tax=Brevibacillus brevis TaxID=1393 RepID=UPI00165D626F|nr:ATP-binding protein [Brevibacillus brevis]
MKHIWVKLAFVIMTVGACAVLFSSLLSVKEMDVHFSMYADEVRNQHNQEISRVALEAYQDNQGWGAEAYHKLEAVSEVLGLHITLLDQQQQVKNEWGKRPVHTSNYSVDRIPLFSKGVMIGQLVISHDDRSAYMTLESHFQWAHKNTTLWTMAVLLILVIIISIPLARTMVRPVVQVSTAAQRVARGNLSIRVPEPRGKDEVTSLVAAFNNLVQSLEHQEELRKRLTSDIAHELRTPLNTLLAQVEGMIDGIWEATPKNLDSTRSEVLRLSRLVRDLDQVIQVESGSLQMRSEEMELREVVKEVTESMSATFARAQVNFHFKGDHAVWITGDRQRLAQIVANLLTNACKHTPAGGKVIVTVDKPSTMVRLQVKDSGTGIDQKDLPYVFERFYRGDRSRARERGGAGLGLTIVKGIVEAHKGIISLDSSVGEGTTITILFPPRAYEGET